MCTGTGERCFIEVDEVSNTHGRIIRGVIMARVFRGDGGKWHATALEVSTPSTSSLQLAHELEEMERMRCARVCVRVGLGVCVCGGVLLGKTIPCGWGCR